MQSGARANRGLKSYPRFRPIPVMPGLVPGIHVFLKINRKKDVDGRDEPGHDD